MRYARPRKHYRAAAEEAKAHTLKGIFIPEEDKPKLALVAAGIGVIVFLLGLLTGAVASDD